MGHQQQEADLFLCPSSPAATAAYIPGGVTAAEKEKEEAFLSPSVDSGNNDNSR